MDGVGGERRSAADSNIVVLGGARVSLDSSILSPRDAVGRVDRVDVGASALAGLSFDWGAAESKSRVSLGDWGSDDMGLWLVSELIVWDRLSIFRSFLVVFALGRMKFRNVSKADGVVASALGVPDAFWLDE